MGFWKFGLLDFSLGFLRCVRCANKLDLEVLAERGGEVEEGFLTCTSCLQQYPIISKIPILWDNFTTFLSSRTSLGGILYSDVSSGVMRSFIRNSLSLISKRVDDRTGLERRWVKIYSQSRNSLFYSKVVETINELPKCDVVLDNGCSIGIMANHIAKQQFSRFVFGTDVSFLALQRAKRDSVPDKTDYFVSDLLCSPLVKSGGFGLVLALNLLELVEPLELLKSLWCQTAKNGYLLLSDPYDYERGINSVRRPLDAGLLRSKLEQLGFEISPSTLKPSFVPWSLTLGPRANLEYYVDLVVAKKVV